jgi:hypothetical protein
MKLQLLVLASIFGVMHSQSIAQNQSKKIDYPAKLIHIAEPAKFIHDDFAAQLLNMEMPTQDGLGYRSFLQQQKIIAKTHWMDNRSTNTRSEGLRYVPQPIINDAGFIPTRRISNGTVQTLIAGIPSDNTSAISNDGIMLVGINSHVYAYNIHTNKPVFENHNITLTNMYSPSPTLASFYDPKIIYDPKHDRFILTFLRGSTPESSRVIMCFSSTNNPADPWYVYELPGNPLDNNRWTDFPCLSITEDKVYYTANLIIPNVSWQVGFDGSVIWEMDKALAYSGATDINATLYYDIKFEDRFVRNLHPVNGADGTAQELVCLSNRNFDITNDTIFYVHFVDGELNVQALKTDVNYGVPPNARQSDTNTDDPTMGLQTNDARPLAAIMFDDEIQFVCNSVDPSTGFSAIYHGTITWADGLEVRGNIIGDEVRDFAYPNIAWTGNEDCDREVIINFLYSSPNIFPGAAAVYVDNDRNTSDVLVIKEGENIIDRLPGGYERWGDYTGLQRKFNETGIVYSFTYHALADKRNTGYGVALLSPDSSKIVASLNLNSPLQVCGNFVNAQVSGAVPPLQYIWNNGEITSNNEYGPFCVNEEVSCTVLDARGCSETINFSSEFTPPSEDMVIFPNPAPDYAVALFNVEGTPVIKANLYDNAGNLIAVLLEQVGTNGMNQLIFLHGLFDSRLLPLDYLCGRQENSSREGTQGKLNYVILCVLISTVMQKKHWFIFILFLLIFVDFSFGQCAMCKANLESNIEEEVSFGKTINTGILMLMIAPYIILLLLFRKKIKGIFNNLIKG